MNVHQFPQPSTAWLQLSNGSEAPPQGLASAAAQWKPFGANESSVLVHFSHRILDGVSGMAYSADELETKIIGLLAAHDGEPVNYVANVQATCDWVVGATTVAMTANAAGTAGNVAVLNIVDPGVITGATNAAPNGNEIDVTPETNTGDNAAAEITTSGTAMTVKHYLTGYDGNGHTITFALTTASDLPLGSRVVPSAALTATSPAAGNIAVALGTAAGVTTAVLQVGESVGASGGSFKIDQKAAYIGTWANTKVRCQVVLPGTVGQTLGVTCDYDSETAPTTMSITVSLATTAEGAPDAAANTDTLVVAAVNAALAAKVILGALDWGDVLLCTKLSSAKIFSSPNAWQSMASGVNALADNTANAVAFLKTALEALPDGAGAIPNYDVTADGTGHVSGATTETFAGGGENYASVATVNDVISAMQAIAGPERQFSTEITAGDGTDVVPIGGDVLDWNDSGVDEVPGTPAKLGRLAIGFATGEETVKSVWTAFTDDPTTTQAGWVKTYTGS